MSLSLSVNVLFNLAMRPIKKTVSGCQRGLQGSVVLVAFTVAILVSLALCLLGWRWYWAWWTGSSLVAFLLYGFDKFQAQRGSARVPEVALHLLALAGGVAGAWLGRIVFRHKTRHFSFTMVLVLAALLHGALLLWLRR